MKRFEIDAPGIIAGEFDLPFHPYPYQLEGINTLCAIDRSALFWEAGLGKTLGAACCALFKMVMEGTDLTICIMPPILITNWSRFLRSIKRKDGTPLKVLAYRGTPSERKATTFDGQDFVCMSMQIFKRDIHAVERMTARRKVHVIADEAQAIKNVASQNHRVFSQFCADKTLQLLTGTPLNNPGDAYAYIKLKSPGVYRSLYQFENLHVDSRDFFGNVTGWRELDLLKENLMLNAHRKIKEEVLVDLPPAIVSPIYYDMSHKHAAIYKRLAEEQMLKFENGTKIDATSVSALFHALGQIVCNLAHFSGEPDAEAAVYELVDETLEELGDKKLVVFTNYRMTSRAMLARYSKSHSAVGVWGEVSPKEKDAAIARFIEDPACRVIVMQQQSIAGVDGLQHVCTDCIFVEVPSVASVYEQAMSRLYRDGQKGTVTVRLAVANGTLQARTLTTVAKKQDLVNSLQGGIKDLKAAVFGG